MRKLVKLLAAACCALALGTLALGGLSSTPAEVHAGGKPGVPRDRLVLLLKGIYEPVTDGPDLGLSTVDLDDGTYAKCDIHRVRPGPSKRTKPIGNFYVNIDVTLCAYQLPGGAFAAGFTDFVYEEVVIDGELYQVGTAELVITEGTGRYRRFVNGSIHMEFITRVIDMDAGIFDEFCFCFIIRDDDD